LLRNSSVIVDLMFGQFKSIVDCPQCQFESIQFDPFLMCTLPLVNDNLKKIEVTYLKDHFRMTSLTVCYEASWGWKM
jgi:ubiquitin carboxyl-terminal hydrolase 4/11/15